MCYTLSAEPNVTILSCVSIKAKYRAAQKDMVSYFLYMVISGIAFSIFFMRLQAIKFNILSDSLNI